MAADSAVSHMNGRKRGRRPVIIFATSNSSEVCIGPTALPSNKFCGIKMISWSYKSNLRTSHAMQVWPV